MIDRNDRPQGVIAWAWVIVIHYWRLRIRAAKLVLFSVIQLHLLQK